MMARCTKPSHLDEEDQYLLLIRLCDGRAGFDSGSNSLYKMME